MGQPGQHSYIYFIYILDRYERSKHKKKIGNYIAFGKSTSQRIYPEQHTPPERVKTT